MNEQKGRINQIFGDYRLTDLLRRGGFGDVCLGKHIRNQTLTAIKVLNGAGVACDVTMNCIFVLN